MEATADAEAKDAARWEAIVQSPSFAELKAQWTAISTACVRGRLTCRNQTWVQKYRSVHNLQQLARHPALMELFQFRRALVTFITTAVCDPKQCDSFGNTAVTSDVDVSISFSHEDMFWVNLRTLRRINKLLQLLCVGMALPDIYKLFDLNFYLSDFVLFKSKRAARRPFPNPLALDAIYVSTDYSRDPERSQFAFAFHAVVPVPTDAKLKLPEFSHPIDFIENAILKMHTTAARSREKATNLLVYHISLISTFEDECYHSQGAFVHVVLMMQRGIAVTGDLAPLLQASAVENLCFAVVHPAVKRNKYLNRAWDALKRMGPLGPLGPLGEPFVALHAFLNEHKNEVNNDSYEWMSKTVVHDRGVKRLLRQQIDLLYAALLR